MKHKIYFGNLDALRSIAALLVLMSHLIYETLNKYFSNIVLENPFFNFFFQNGGLGVKLFFILSGFLITYLILEEIKVKGNLNFRNFYIRRILRIWPVYFIVLLIVFLIIPILKTFINQESNIDESIFMSIFFLTNFDLIRLLSDSNLNVNGMLAVTWSVSVEEQFYFFWPILLVVFYRFKILLFLIILFISLIFMIVSSNDNTVFYYHTLNNFIFLLTGAILAYLMVHKKNILKSIDEKLKLNLNLILLTLLFAMILSKDFLYKIEYGNIIYNLLTVLSIFILLYSQLLCKNKVYNFSNISFLMNIAKYTYGVYMYHRIAQYFSNVSLYKILNLTPSIYIDLVHILLSFIITFIMAYMSYKFIEKPLLKLKDNFFIFYKGTK